MGGAMSDDPLIPTVNAIIILDDEGTRLVAKYFGGDLETDEKQFAFEKTLFSKTSRLQTARHDTDIIMLESSVIVFHFISDVLMYVVGKADDNEMLLEAVLNALTEVLQQLLSNGLGSQVEKLTLMEHLEKVLVCVDELVDGGMVLETDPAVVNDRV